MAGQFANNGLAKLNSFPPEKLQEELLRICGSHRWVDAVSRTFPHDDVDSVLNAMDKIWWSLSHEDWLEAFAAHPKIGDAAGLRKKFESSAAAKGPAWEAEEQKGAEGAKEETLQSLAEYNKLYEKKYGYIFLVCATGKTAEEMLNLLQERMSNEATVELSVAAGEQAKITVLRLQKLLSALGDTSRL